MIPSRLHAAASEPSPAPEKFEDLLARLEQIVGDMESADLPLEKLLSSYEEGMRLVKACGDRLVDAEQKVEILSRQRVRRADRVFDCAACHQHRRHEAGGRRRGDSVDLNLPNRPVFSLMRCHLLILLAVLSRIDVSGQTAYSTNMPPSVPDESKVALIFSGGHETDPRDRGRPVVLIAAALGVPDEVFRDAFRHVHPAPAGEQPDPAQVRRNKQELLSRLAPYGVTNERLDEVSNYYRYRPGSGELWRHTDAQAFAILHDGVVTGITMTNSGSGYSSPPEVSVSGVPNIHLSASISFGTDIATNGSISRIKVVPATP